MRVVIGYISNRNGNGYEIRMWLVCLEIIGVADKLELGMISLIVVSVVIL